MALDREKLVTAGLRLLDELGLDGLSLRKLATEFDVQASAIYWHFKNKQELLDEMATAMFRELLTEGSWPEPRDWRACLDDTGRHLRRMLLSRRDGARMAAGTYLTDDSLLTSMEIPLRLLTQAGFSMRDGVRAFTTVYSFTIGFTIEEQAVHDDPRYADIDRRARFDTERFPLTAAAGPEVFGSPDERFDHGLRLIIAGIGAVAAPGRPGASSTAKQ
ncbi:MAG: TetR/AcrR family transcriptional regulator [Stackebrandtia sp.]